jgi:L-ascorbate metabolism protein UlaG (beta-lactamase superfamily)
MSFKKKSTWTVRLLRHATLVIRTTVKKEQVTLLVDPMFSPKGAMDPVANAGNDIRIPMVDLPVTPRELEVILATTDHVLLTHTHRDHWDVAAQQTIYRQTSFFCQVEDLEKLKEQGFERVSAALPGSWTESMNLKFHWIEGQHGQGEIGKKMGSVNGYVIESGKQKLYVAGDTIWCKPVEDAIKEHQPDVIIVNAGGAEFLTGGRITMNTWDIKMISKAAPNSKIIAVHMDTVNHCKVTRDILKKFVADTKLANVVIPADGETLTF